MVPGSVETTTMLTSVLLLCLLAIATANYVPPFSRNLIIGADKLNPTNDLDGVLDIGHQRMLTYPSLFTQADADAVDAECDSWMAERFGLSYPERDVYKISANSVSSNYPFSSGYDFSNKVLYDSANAYIGKSQDWAVLDYGCVVLFNTSGTFPTSGGAYEPGDFAIYIKSVAVKLGSNWDLSVNKHYWTYKSICPVKQFILANGFVGQAGIGEITSGNDVGRGQISVLVETTPIGNVLRNKMVINYF